MKIEFDFYGEVQVKREILRPGKQAQNLRPVWNKLADFFMEIEEGQFATEGARGSDGWPELKATTVRRKAAKNQDPRILRATQALYRSLTRRGEDQLLVISDDFMIFGSKLDYGGYHQKGKVPGAPRRRPIEFTEMDRRDTVKILQRWILTGELA